MAGQVSDAIRVSSDDAGKETVSNSSKGGGQSYHAGHLYQRVGPLAEADCFEMP